MLFSESKQPLVLRYIVRMEFNLQGLSNPHQNMRSAGEGESLGSSGDSVREQTWLMAGLI